MKYTYLTKKEYAYQSIKEEIIQGELRPGDKINIQKYAEKYGMSPIPVREALSQLYYEGLVQSIPCVGSVVAEFDIDKVFETMAMRYALERICFMESIRNMDDEYLDDLRGIINGLEKLYLNNDIKTYMVKTHDFYLKLYALSTFKTIKEEVDSLYMLNRVNSAILNPKHIKDTIKGNRRLLDLIEKGKYNDAEKLHIEIKVFATISVLDLASAYINEPTNYKNEIISAFYYGIDVEKRRIMLLEQIDRNKKLLLSLL